MAEVKEIHVPDIGDFDAVDVIEVLVSAGDQVQAEDSLITLESDKATMEVPCPEAGTVKEVLVGVGDKVAEGTAVIKLEVAGEGGGDDAAAADKDAGGEKPEAAPAEEAPAASASGGGGGGGTETVTVPDIGDFDAVDVIEVLVAAGDEVEAEQPLITLESDKASMEVPSPQAGKVSEVLIKVGDKVSEGTPIVRLETSGGAPAPATAEKAPAPAAAQEEAPSGAASLPEEDAGAAPSIPPRGPTADSSLEMDHEPIERPIDPEKQRLAHAGPSVRRFARELGVPLEQVQGTGRKGRITREDVQAFVKRALQGGAGAAAPAAAPAAAGGMGIPPIPEVDFSKFGEVEEQPLSRIKKLSGPHLHRSWLNVPHVTQFDEADITELEAFRQAEKAAAEKAGVKLTPLAFLVKASARALVEFPNFNSSLKPSGDALILKKYVNIGVAVDTPQGLVVPVIKDADRKGVYDIAADLATLSGKARDGKLGPGDMQGGTFSISSLGGLGGTAFTPIVNAPEVAILGVSKSSQKPVWDGSQFVPRLMLPLSLSYDHRVIDGAAAARFTTYLAGLLGDLRRLIL
ncbi:dihydrolipoyllysine-residue acetyltransferase [Sediminicurvatus halobius]|uniref:Acetyltransferase component of pyruvate dehydrogenase complex n=1 Tax=Sediminicurvatus halobius TaxID=2182432 RepID=A0A2U2MYY1_9GAMM|nr:dihydrolipoyllysine-residue acetyltransferase [Spiribacter halobius]PWG62205.1 dihydrolipoyllysine-residue acetyltransferase [Spiribacter halobius]UEX78111.1 dihydrolipoyllysine-residue acetyltransferase [Spiribacter halobius]